MARAGRWSGDVRPAGSQCDGEANDGKRLNDDYIQRINHNYHCTMQCLRRDSEVQLGGLFMHQSMSPSNFLAPALCRTLAHQQAEQCGALQLLPQAF